LRTTTETGSQEKNSEFFQSFFSEFYSEKTIQRKIQSSPNLPKEKGEIVGRAGFPACSSFTDFGSN
jgi:hypothetical protein